MVPQECRQQEQNTPLYKKCVPSLNVTVMKKRKGYKRVATATRKGLTFADTRLLQHQAEACERDDTCDRNVPALLNRIMILAETCSRCNYPGKAASLFRQARELAIEEDYRRLSMQNRHTAQTAARRFVEEMRKVAPQADCSHWLKETRSYYDDDLYYLSHYLD